MDLQFENCEEFSKFYFDWTPFEYQADALNSWELRQMIVAGRQSGKSDVVALKALYYATQHPFSNVIVLAPTKIQSEIIITKIKNFIVRSRQKFPELKFHGNIERDIATRIDFKNGSVIRNFTIGDNADSVVGQTAHVVIIDEAAQVRDIAYDRIIPMLAATNGVLICISTPRGVNNKFYKFYVKPEYGFRRWKWKSEQSPLITKEFLNGERAAKSTLMFAEEYEAEFIDVSDSAFPMKVIENAINLTCPERDYPIPGSLYYFGFDPSEGGDACVLYVLEDNPLYKAVVKCIELPLDRIQELTVPKIMQLMKHYNFVFKPRKIFMDATGFGQSIAQMLMNDGLPIEPIRIVSPAIKTEMFSNLGTQLQNRTFVIPPNQKLIVQLNSIKIERMETGDIRYKTDLFADDHATALALVAMQYASPKAEFVFSRTKSVW